MREGFRASGLILACGDLVGSRRAFDSHVVRYDLLDSPPLKGGNFGENKCLIRKIDNVSQ